MFRRCISSSDLSLDRSCVFISNIQDADSPTLITGRFRVSYSQVAYIKRIRVRLRGMLQIPRDGDLITEDRKSITFEQDQVLAGSRNLRSFPMSAGDYEFAFSIVTTDTLLDTVTGPKHHYHSYQVDAIVERPFKRDFVTSQPLRIYTKPDFDADYLMPEYPLTVEGQSEQHHQYSISIPNRMIPFGSVFSVRCSFSAPSKDTPSSIAATVSLEVTERHHLELDATAVQATRDNIHHVRSNKTHTVFRETSSLSPESRMDSEWHFCRLIHLPHSFNACSQSIATKIFRISHELVIKVQVQDATGAVFAMIAESIPFSIFIAPSVIGEDAAIRCRLISDSTDPPPAYGDHVCHPKLAHFTGVGEYLNFQQALRGQNHRLEALGPIPGYE